MFDEFKAQWTPALFSEELKARPVGSVIAGEKVVFFRDASGAPRALIDRCPHRGVSLSLGTVEAGCLRCPFHGWVFDGQGACTSVPWNPDVNRTGLSATAMPARELGGLIWLYTAPVAQAPTEPEVPEAMLLTGTSRGSTSAHWATHWTRAMENMLDSPHVPFVHRATIGNPRTGLPAMALGGAEMVFDLVDQPWGYHVSWNAGKDKVSGAWIEWRRPNSMTLNIPAGRVYRQHVWCVPTTPGHTRMMLVSVRDFGWYINWAMGLSNWYERKILSEDQAVLASSDPPVSPRPGQDKSVPTDKPTMVFRRWYYKNLVDGGSAEGSASG